MRKERWNWRGGNGRVGRLQNDGLDRPMRVTMNCRMTREYKIQDSGQGSWVYGPWVSGNDDLGDERGVTQEDLVAAVQTA